MRIVQYIKAGEDCPAEMANSPEFAVQLIASTKRRLQLREQDTVEIVFV